MSICRWWTKMWYIDTVEYYSAIKKNDTVPAAAAWMDLETSVLSEARKRQENTIWYCLYVASKKKMIQMNLLQNRYRICLPMKETWIQLLGQEDPLDRGAWWATVHGVAYSWTRLRSKPPPPSHLKQITNKDLLYSTENSAQYSVIN